MGALGKTAWYLGRGWCFFELSVSSLVKGTNNLISLDSFYKLKGNLIIWNTVASSCKACRLPPMSPDTFSEKMRAAVQDGKLRFTAGGDLEKVLPNYGKFYSLVSPIE